MRISFKYKIFQYFIFNLINSLKYLLFIILFNKLSNLNNLTFIFL